MPTISLMERTLPPPAQPRALASRAVAAARAHPLEAWCAAALLTWLLILGAMLPVDADEGVYTVVARGMLDGRWPYRDLFDHKQPLLYALYLPSAIAGIEAQRALAAASAAASLPAFAALARRWLSVRPAAIAIVAYGVLIASPQIGIVRNAEAFLLLPLLLALVAPSALLAGALLGVAIGTKSVAVAFAPLVLWRWRHDAPRALLGIAVPLALCALAVAPVARDAWTANVTFNRAYATADGHARIAALYAFDPSVLAALLPVWLAAFAGLAFARSWRLLTFAALSMAAVRAPGYDFTHYYALAAPAAAMLAALALDRAWLFVRARGGPLPERVARAAIVSVAALCLAAALSLNIAGVVHLAVTDDPYADIARAAKAHPGELYVLGEKGQVYVLADRMPDRRFFTSIPLAVREAWGDDARHGLLACPPDVLVTIEDTPLFDIPWRGEVEAMYRSREEFAHGAVLTRPSAVCAARSR